MQRRGGRDSCGQRFPLAATVAGACPGCRPRELPIIYNKINLKK
jgi:hypothetical protein